MPIPYPYLTSKIGFHLVVFPLILACLHSSEWGVFVFFLGQVDGEGLFGELSLEVHYILFPGFGTHSFIRSSLVFIPGFSKLNIFTSIII